MPAKDAINFFGKYLKNPRITGAVCPSSPFLARKMAQSRKPAHKPHDDGIVVELGPGTGPVTKYLIKSGVSPAMLCSIEFDKGLAAALQKKFPNIRVFNGSAEYIKELLGAEASRVSAIVSSLPLVSLPEPCVRRIITEIETVLPKGGRFVQFTYKLNRKPASLGFKQMRHLGTSFVMLNIPPARVDVFEKI